MCFYFLLPACKSSSSTSSSSPPSPSSSPSSQHHLRCAVDPRAVRTVFHLHNIPMTIELNVYYDFSFDLVWAVHSLRLDVSSLLDCVSNRWQFSVYYLMLCVHVLLLCQWHFNTAPNQIHKYRFLMFVRIQISEDHLNYFT